MSRHQFGTIHRVTMITSYSTDDVEISHDEDQVARHLFEGLHYKIKTLTSNLLHIFSAPFGISSLIFKVQFPFEILSYVFDDPSKIVILVDNLNDVL
uniref:Uncharacterized protein n=1 Tax=Lutzomyia longipalpis TaxID=7200 RepID=A0A1B0CW02_LUTLO